MRFEIETTGNIWGEPQWTPYTPVSLEYIRDAVILVEVGNDQMVYIIKDSVLNAVQYSTYDDTEYAGMASHALALTYNLSDALEVQFLWIKTLWEDDGDDIEQIAYEWEWSDIEEGLFI